MQCSRFSCQVSIAVIDYIAWASTIKFSDALGTLDTCNNVSKDLVGTLTYLHYRRLEK